MKRHGKLWLGWIVTLICCVLMLLNSEQMFTSVVLAACGLFVTVIYFLKEKYPKSAPFHKAAGFTVEVWLYMLIIRVLRFLIIDIIGR